jgi:hypothetical protein
MNRPPGEYRTAVHRTLFLQAVVISRQQHYRAVETTELGEDPNNQVVRYAAAVEDVAG